MKLKRKENLENLQKEGLTILKLHEKLEKANIKHEFIDRKEERTKMIKEDETLFIVNNIYLFDYQILIEEKGNQISLVQSPFSYGIMNNLIEIYNFSQEPITLLHTDAFKFIKHKCLNDYIYFSNNILYKEPGEDSKQMRETLHKFIKIIMESEDD